MKYKLKAVVTVSIYTEVEANSLDEAIEIAENRDILSIVPSYTIDKDKWVCSEIDGLPDNITEDI